MSVLDEMWEIAPHDCMSEEMIKLRNGVGCSSFIIPNIIEVPLSKEVAERIVRDHNEFLKARS